MLHDVSLEARICGHEHASQQKEWVSCAHYSLVSRILGHCSQFAPIKAFRDLGVPCQLHTAVSSPFSEMRLSALLFGTSAADSRGNVILRVQSVFKLKHVDPLWVLAFAIVELCKPKSLLVTFPLLQLWKFISNVDVRISANLQGSSAIEYTMWDFVQPETCMSPPPFKSTNHPASVPELLFCFFDQSGNGDFLKNTPNCWFLWKIEIIWTKIWSNTLPCNIHCEFTTEKGYFRDREYFHHFWKLVGCLWRNL